jgi:septal ring factor EnvC (AmiA/AmiB activator)
MDKASEPVLGLRPVIFRYKEGLDPHGVSQFGLVAEEVEKVDPDLVLRDQEGRPYTVRYDAVNAMLLNEFLKEHKRVEELESAVAKQETAIAQQQREFQATITWQENQVRQFDAALGEQAAQIKKLSAQVQLTKPATKVVVNNP